MRNVIVNSNYMSGKTFFYKGVRVNAFGLPILNDKKNRIKRDHRKRKFYYITFRSTFKENSPKNLIVMYDIPHDKSRERDWFRRQLKNFDYVMIQKSVWVGPSPLPNDFLDYVKLVGLKGQLRTFKLSKPYTKRKNSL